MTVAKAASELSTCTRAKVGCCLVKDGRVIGTGYNGSLPGHVHCTDEGCLMQEGHCIRTLHAEQNALLDCAKRGVSTKGTIIYITHFPCMQCTKFLIMAGVEKVVYLEDYRNEDNPFANDIEKMQLIEVT
jgi:dCMP deaminase